MNAEYAFVLWVSAIVSAAVGFAAWRRRSSPGATGLLLLMAACFEWSSTYAMALASTDPVEQEMLLLLTHLGSVIIPAAALLIALEFARREVVVARPAVWLLLVMPVITLAIVATDSRHGLYFGSDGISAHVVTGGPWLWVDILYSYAMIGSAIILIAIASGAASTMRVVNAAPQRCYCHPVHYRL